MADKIFGIDLAKIIGSAMGHLLIDCEIKIDKNNSALANANFDLTKKVPDFVTYKINGIITPDTKGVFLDPNHYGTIEFLNAPEGITINKFDLIVIEAKEYEITRVITDPAKVMYKCWVRERGI